MSINYTTIAENSIDNYAFLDQAGEAIDYLNNPNNFRPFHEGLAELLIKAGYNELGDDMNAKADFLHTKLKQIGSQIDSKTVDSWFSGKHRPKIEPASRIKMYEICFSLNLSMEDTKWFFHHVYFDRCFNCHTIEEAVFYFCFKNSLTYQDAQSLISEINHGTSNASAIAKETGNYTQFLSNRISSFTQTEDFVSFMIDNKPSFGNWNKSAYDTISRWLADLTGSDRLTSSDIDKIKRYLKRKIDTSSNHANPNDVDASLFENCGLLLKEIYHDAYSNENTDLSAAHFISDAINQKSVFLNSFVLERLLNTSSGIQKGKEIPYVVKVNFPRKKSFSDILGQDKSGQNKIDTLQSYDMIRKILVLLHFYVFWLPIKLKDIDIEEYDYEDLFQIYKDEADQFLFDCGYEPLYAGNPYDWLFLCAANNEEPISFFRSCIFEIIDNEDDNKS